MQRHVISNSAFIAALAYLSIFASPTLSAGEIDPSQNAWLAKYQKQPNAPDPSKQLLNTDPEPDLTTGFSPLFEGDDLSDWTPRGGTCSFTAKNGKITGKCVPGSNSTYLCTNKADYTDFIFTCEMKWVADGNSGVMFRAQSKPNAKAKGDGPENETVFGPQAEMEGIDKKRGWSGGIYGQSCGGYFYPLWLKDHAKARDAIKPKGWNRLTVYAKGNVVKTWVNGTPAAHWVGDGTYAKGFFGLQIHKGKQGEVIWKDMKIKTLE